MNHFSVRVSGLMESRVFYQKILATLDYKICFDDEQVVRFNCSGENDPTGHLFVFTAFDAESVRLFFQTA